MIAENELLKGRIMEQPKTNTAELAKAIEEFEEALPGWWWTTGACQVSRDASCGPTKDGPDAHLLKHRLFDDGFHCELHEGTVAQALRNVTQQALNAKAAVL